MVKFMRSSPAWRNFECIEYLCKECLTSLTCKFCTFFRQNLETFETSHLLSVNSYKVINSHKQSDFLAHPAHYQLTLTAVGLAAGRASGR